MFKCVAYLGNYLNTVWNNVLFSHLKPKHDLLKEKLKGKQSICNFTVCLGILAADCSVTCIITIAVRRNPSTRPAATALLCRGAKNPPRPTVHYVSDGKSLI